LFTGNYCQHYWLICRNTANRLHVAFAVLLMLLFVLPALIFSFPMSPSRYCSRACQVAHWKSHKPLCKAMQAAAAAADVGTGAAAAQ
jgi:hypothetical protein